MFDRPISASTALKVGAVQSVNDSFDVTISPPHGAMLLLMRSLLSDGVWQFEAEELSSRLHVWRTSSPGTEPTQRQMDELSQFFPDQFIMPSEAWHWKLMWQARP